MSDLKAEISSELIPSRQLEVILLDINAGSSRYSGRLKSYLPL